MLDNSIFNAPKDKKSTFLFRQVNLKKGGENMDIALQQALEAGAHVVMVQEPCTMEKEGSFTTKEHTGFDSLGPIGERQVQPRAFTITRKGLRNFQMSHPHVK